MRALAGSRPEAAHRRWGISPRPENSAILQPLARQGNTHVALQKAMTMHPNPVFHTETDQKNLAYAQARSFGVLAVNGESGPLMSHVPFLMADDWQSIDIHLLRSNPIARLLKTPQTARIAVSGGDSYVSPDWYEAVDQVPTWNYVAVHIWGQLELLPQDMLGDMLDRQSHHFEAQLAPKPEWTRSKMTQDVMDRMMRTIVPVRLHVEGVDGTWKLNQNKPDDVRMRAADAVETHGIGTDLTTLAALMRDA